MLADVFNPETVAILIPVLFVIGGVAIAIVAIIGSGREKELAHKERLVAMEKGIEIPTEKKKEKRPQYLAHRTTGLVMFFLGIAITIGNWVAGGAVAGVWGLVPLLMGVGFLISATLEKKELAEQKQKDGSI